MTTIQLKAEMHHIIDGIPEDKISEVFNYLRTVQLNKPAEDKIDEIIDRIFVEDDALLRRLAQ